MATTPSKPRAKRLRQAVKWAGPIACVALATMIGVGAWCWIAWTSPNGRLSVASGHGVALIASIDPARSYPGLDPGWSITRAQPPGVALLPGVFEDNGYLALAIPLWIPLGALGWASAAAWRAERRERRRMKAGLCPRCHYDLTANTTNLCPECGAKTTPQAPSSL
jgi:hypothetical protein